MEEEINKKFNGVNPENILSETINEIDESKQIENLKKLEAIFFVSGRFLSMPELISLSDLNPILIREIIEKLQERYLRRHLAYGFSLGFVNSVGLLSSVSG